MKREEVLGAGPRPTSVLRPAEEKSRPALHELRPGSTVRRNTDSTVTSTPRRLTVPSFLPRLHSIQPIITGRMVTWAEPILDEAGAPLL